MLAVIIAFILLAVLLVWYLLRHDHGRQLPAVSLWTAFGFGIVAMVLASVLEGFAIPDTVWTTPENIPMVSRFLLGIVIGVIEEAAKFLPLAFFIFHKSYFRFRTDGVIFFAICGLTFGLGENILYTVTYGAETGLFRLVVTPFFHAAATSILGYYLVSAKVNGGMWGKCIMAATVIPFLHGMYDFGLFSQSYHLYVVSFMITLLLSLGLFLYFMQANDLDQQSMPATAPEPNYCTGCGRPNPRHLQYCEQCGRHLYITANTLRRAV